jgi:hypothetical protein
MSQQINLYNARLERQKNYFSTQVLAAALGVVLVVLIGVSALVRSQLAAVQKEADQVKLALAAGEARRANATAAFVPRVRSAALQQEAEQAAIEHRNLQQVSALLEQHPDQGMDKDKDLRHGAGVRGYSAYFRALARRRIDGLWLTGVTIDSAGEAIGLQGRMLKASLLPGYLDGLAGEAVLRGKTFGHLEMREPKAPAGTPDAPPPRYVEFNLQSRPSGERADARQP